MAYRDFSHLNSTDDTIDPTVLGLDTDESSSQNFPAKLHYVLNELEKDGMSHIVGWAPHGRSFCVRKPQQFVELILARWFRQTKYTSFQRQLNIYGFTRIASGPEKGGYYHEMFLRGKSFLSERIPRKQIKGTGSKKSIGQHPTPDFRAMSFLPETSVNIPAPAQVPMTPGAHGSALSLDEAIGLARNLTLLRSHPIVSPEPTPLQRSAFASCLDTTPRLGLPYFPMSLPPPSPMNLSQALVLQCMAQRQAIDDRRNLFLQSLLQNRQS